MYDEPKIYYIYFYRIYSIRYVLNFPPINNVWIIIFYCFLHFNPVSIENNQNDVFFQIFVKIVLTHRLLR